jgi:outer membrane protein TolC
MRHAGRAAISVATALLALVARAAEPQTGPDAATGPEAPAEPMRLTLEQCIELGIEHSVQFLTQEETFILQQLAAALERHNYRVLPTSTVSAEAASDNATKQSASLALARRLLTGGALKLSADTSGAQNAENAYTSSVSLSLDQPLLRGAGRLVAREDLTQAERNLVYAGRDLVLFKQQFLIDIVQKYYELISQGTQIRNQQERVTQAQWLLDRTRALVQTAANVTPIDVLRAEVNLLQAQNDLVDAQELYRLQIDNFKLDLGLPMDREVELVETPLTFQATQVELAPSVETALANRLDLKTARDATEDASRALAIARNNLRGDLGLTARVGYSTEPETSFSAQRVGEPEWAVGLEYQIPLDRKAEKTTYRDRLIAYARAMRDANRTRDEVVLGVRQTVRDLRQAEATIGFQQKNIELGELRLQRAMEDLNRGTVTTRDVEEAQNELRDARNALVRAQVTYIIATIQLHKDIGVLDFDRWRELIR